MITNEPVDIDVLEGDTATFSCSALAEPLPIYYWKFEQTFLTNTTKYRISSAGYNTSLLMILGVLVSDAGEYTCLVSNPHGNDSAVGELQVLSESQYYKCHSKHNHSLPTILPCTQLFPSLRQCQEITMWVYKAMVSL